ncbi:signaling protein [Corynebacterium sp. HMSC063A05]|uniref:ATP-dependent helicase n=1 Tax=unclassified Corynebacterium TaxID=2624378 RepID=UPI0006693575|nr:MULTISPECIES: ATP-dependent DNA helicase [unclassified Corynebacterium]OFM85757.1 signaling protein [Corynebacterium sp. HMSC063A05]
MSEERTIIDPGTLSEMMGQDFPPTPQQAAVIGAPMEPMLVVAGAGAGKTATMASRVVWLVANGFIRPEEVLGLTFTRKAARELGVRIRQQLNALASSAAFRAQASPKVLASLEVIAPTTLTYDAYASEVVSNYGLLLPTEPGVTIMDGATQWQLAWETARNVKEIDVDIAPSTLASRIIELGANIDSNLSSPQAIREETEAFISNIEQTPQKGKREGLIGDLQGIVDKQRERLEILPLVEQVRARCNEENVATFGMQMARAARLATDFAEVGEEERRRFKIIMLDEYQDTSHTQRLFLRALFSGGCVTAVGDPMQAIYGWRGATAENLVQFVNDFPRSDGKPAEKKQLTISWRNPQSVLQLANAVSDRAFAGQARTVEALDAGPKAGQGEVQLAFTATGEEEVAYIADCMEAQLRECEAAGNKLDAAILVRTNAESAVYLDALSERGVPAIIVGLAGLLHLPEVMDITSVMKILVDPSSDQDALRLLLSPQVNLGAADVEALRTRVDQLAMAGKDELARKKGNLEETSDSSPLSQLARQYDKLVEDAEAASSAVGLGHAIADPDIRFYDGTPLARGSVGKNGRLVCSESLNYTDEAMARIAQLGASLRKLRRFSLNKPLPELVEDIATEFGIRVEAAAGQYGSATAITRPTTAHLDRFVDIAATYSQNISDDVTGFLNYLEFAVEHDDGLERAPMNMPENCVQIMTMHKSKGLEWETVAVPGITTSKFDRVDLSSWLTNSVQLPPGAITQVDPLTASAETTGDATQLAAGDWAPVADSVDSNAPELDISGADNQTDLNKVIKAYKEELREVEREEKQRLFYVAMTRSAKKLIVTASRRPNPSLKKPTDVSADFAAIATQFSDYVVSWTDGEDPEVEDTEVDLDCDTAVDGVVWPVDTLGNRRDSVQRAAESVMRYMGEDQDERPIAGDLSEVWETETTILVDEIRRAKAAEIHLPMPTSMSTSEYQAMIADPVAFARRKARPVPFKPNRFARRGTAFHAWLENRFGAHSLLDDEDLFGNQLDDFLGTEQVASERELEKLKANFEASEWADRTPVHVEVPFEIAIGQRRVVGRIDAVFKDNGKWSVIDWKTGQMPRGKEREVAALQLAIYRLAWSDRLREMGVETAPEDIEAGFFYVSAGRTLIPDEALLPSRIELDRKMRELIG